MPKAPALSKPVKRKLESACLLARVASAERIIRGFGILIAVFGGVWLTFVLYGLIAGGLL